MKLMCNKINGSSKKRQPDIICPYCGRRAVLRPAEYVYGSRNIVPGSRLYVCSNYPAGCDAYVGVHEGSNNPKGILADGNLRNKRIQAHRAFDRLWKSRLMTRSQAYGWLAFQLGIEPVEAHIGYFSDYYCEQTIAECEKFWNGCCKRAA